MKKFEVQLHLNHLRDTRAELNRKVREFNADWDHALKHLIFHGAANMMSAQDIGKAAGLSTAAVKAKMKKFNLNPTKGKTLLSKHAAKVLAENADLMGVDPAKMDLMSPLAYLPAGKNLFPETVSKVTELPGERDYEDSKRKFEASIILGIAAEEDWDGPSIKPGDLTSEQIEWLASWLAGDVRRDDPVVHTINFYDDEIACGYSQFVSPLLVSADREKITCRTCLARTYSDYQADEVDL